MYKQNNRGVTEAGTGILSKQQHTCVHVVCAQSFFMSVLTAG